MDELNIQFVSDIHLESRGRYGDWWKNEIVPTAPYLVLAGDIAPLFHPELPRFYEWCIDNFDQIIHVPGNHEYWGYKNRKYTMYEGEMYMKTLCNEYGILFAQKEVISLEEDSPDLICCTLWSRTPSHMTRSNDFVSIKDLDSKLRNKIHTDHLNFIKYAINGSQLPPIVVTHHAPLVEGTQRREHVGKPEAPLYTNNLGWLTDRCCAWIFGHTHHVCDIYRENGCVITSNPIGNFSEHLPYDTSAVLSIRY